MENLLNVLLQLPSSSYLYSFSALDKYFRKTRPPLVLVATTATLIELARTFSDIEYPGTDEADARISVDGTTLLIRTIESVRELEISRIPQLNLLYDVRRRIFMDRAEIYPALRSGTIRIPDDISAPLSAEELGELGLLTARYHYLIEPDDAEIGERNEGLSPERERNLLSMLITGGDAPRGLEFLMKTGFVAVHWPELNMLNSIDHSKEYHPEGNVWEHTMAALGERKTMDLDLGLGLLLHDIGKGEARKNEGNQFHHHAQIGSFSAADFLWKRGFDRSTVENVRYLVRHHMLPAAVDKIPSAKTEKIVSSPLFPLLLELFRCDLASSRRDLAKYYTACKWYRRYQKNIRNPFRNTDGKKNRRSDYYQAAGLSKPV